MNSRVAFVIPWYGETISGGAESQCRSTAKALLASGVPVEVLTTCVHQFASDWNDNYHPEGLTVEGGVPVRRFAVRQRDTTDFDAVNYKLMHNLPITAAEEELFMNEMIHSPRLYEFIDTHRDEYVFLFLPYMFGTTWRGAAVCPERSVVIPCLHDEAYARMRPIRELCERVRGLIFNSAQEQQLAQKLYYLDPDRMIVCAEPVNCDWSADPERFRRRYALSDFFLYAGRTEKGKGADLLVEYFGRYVDETARPECLVFIGGGDLDIPKHQQSRILKLGFLPTQDKYDAYAAAIALCVPSLMESFSIVTMESWLAGRPVVVNARCPVTRGFCLESNGGLYFADYQEFREILTFLVQEPEISAAMGANGRNFVLANFHPDAVTARYVAALERWGF
jgi:glycosyltransferase involved in cell wall biosynthesis